VEDVAGRRVRDRPLVWGAVAVLAAGAFGVITYGVVHDSGPALLDGPVYGWVGAHRLGWLTSVLRVATWLGSGAVLLGVLLVTLVFCGVRAQRPRRASMGERPAGPSAPVPGGIQGLAWATAGYAVGWAIRYQVMLAVHRPRPPAAGWQTPATGWAYPSGHTLNAALGWGLLVTVLVFGAGGPSRRRGRPIWLVLAAALTVLTVAASRVYLGVHWLTDVLGSVTLGVALLATWVLVGLAWRRHRHRAVSARPRARSVGTGARRESAVP